MFNWPKQIFTWPFINLLTVSYDIIFDSSEAIKIFFQYKIFSYNNIRPAWSESSLCAQWVTTDPSFLHTDSGDSDQTGRMPRLSWVFPGRTAILLVLSCRGSVLVLGFKIDNESIHNSKYCTASFKKLHPSQADLSLRWAHTHFAGFVVS